MYSLSTRLCLVCEDIHTNRDFGRYFSICRRCKNYYGDFNPDKMILIDCVRCNTKKALKAFRFIRKDKNGYNYNVCRLCKNFQIKIEANTNAYIDRLTFIKYCENIVGRINRNLHFISKKTNNCVPFIPFCISKIDVIAQYNRQNGRCAISNEQLTHYICDTKIMIFKYPKNLVIQLIEPSLGYVRDNIILVCAEYTIMKKSPGFITERINKYITIINVNNFLALYNLNNLENTKKDLNICPINSDLSNNISIYKYCNNLYNNLKIIIDHINNFLPLNKKVIFNISEVDIICQYFKQDGICAESYLRMTYELLNSNVAYPLNISVDTINKSLGYVRHNIRLVCFNCLTEKEKKSIKRKMDSSNTIDTNNIKRLRLRC